MAKVKIVTMEQSLPVALPADAGGEVESCAYLHSANDPLHLQRHKLSPGASLCVRGEPTDRLVYVFEGAVTACGHRLSPGSSMIIEYGAMAEVAAGAEGGVVLTFNQAERPADARPGGDIHILPREAVPHTLDMGTNNEMGGGIHADAACPTCKVWLHENDFHGKNGTVIPLHAHSEDEIIFVTAGEIRLGRRSFGPGTAFAIAANTIYGFHASCGLSFINFRAASPTVSTQNGAVLIDEAAHWVSRLGRPNYVAMRSATSQQNGIL